MDLRSAISTIAPTLATMLGGPLAGTAVSAIEGCFGLSAGTGQDGITKVIQTGGMTPETIARVRETDQKHAEILSQQNIDLQKINLDYETSLQKIAADDRDSARKRESSVGDYTARNLAYLVVLGGGAMIGFTLAGWTRVDSVLAGTLIGYAVGEMKQVLTYYFGSSASSDRKTGLLANRPPQ